MNRRTRGKVYEQAAADYLEQLGYTIIATNYRAGRNEIDIICSLNRDLIFVEVKGSASDKFGDPVYRIDERKQQAIIKVAQGFIQQSTVTYDSYRFDVITIVDKGGSLKVDHLPAAFTS